MEVFSDEKGRASINRQSMNKSMKWCERGSCSLLIQDSECDSDFFFINEGAPFASSELYLFYSVPLGNG